MRQTRRTTIRRNTPISVEREFSLFHADARPASRATTNRFIESLRSRILESNGRRATKVVNEVAGNAFEIVIPFSTPDEIRDDVREAYLQAINEAAEQRLLIIGISPPIAPTEFNQFFTTKAFPLVTKFLGITNSIHVHVGGRSEKELLTRYRAQNIIAPVLLDLSQSSIIDGIERGRAAMFNLFFNSIPNELSSPWRIESLREFYNKIEGARATVQSYINENHNGNLGLLCEQFPDFATMNGNGLEILKLTPDKIFHFGRERPDMKSDEYGLEGSVEIRSIDGQATLERDLAMIELALGSLAYLEERMGWTELSTSEIETAMKIVRSASEPWNNERRERSRELITNAVQGLKEMGIEQHYLGGAVNIAENPPYLRYRGMESAQLIRVASEQFMGSV